MPSKIIQKAINISMSLESLSEPFDIYIVFIDLCDSTAFKQFCIENSIPDAVWIMRQKIFLSRTAELIEKYGGDITKTIGDEIMATFNVAIEPERILKCVLEVFQTFRNLKSYNKGKFKVLSKAAVDYGSCYDGQMIIPNKIDPIGTAVDRCARLKEHVLANEIVLSEDYFRVLESANVNLGKYRIESSTKDLKGLGNVGYYIIKSGEVGVT